MPENRDMDDREQALGTGDGAPVKRRLPSKRTAAQSSAKFYAEETHVSDERETDEREVSEDRELSDNERFEMFKAGHYQSVLPDLPHMPGYHVCWLTTSNPRDSISKRMQMGYKLIRLEDSPGWDGITMDVAGFHGVIGVNEMVAARIPLRLYNRYFKELHHTAPLQEEQKLRQAVDTLKEQANRMGAAMDEGDGTESVVQRAEPPPDARY